MYVVSPFGQPPKLKGKRVLVVEDEAPVSMLLEDELRDAGATVLGPAACVGDALRLVEAAAADGGISAAVLDINLEGERALPVAGRLAALSVPFVFATGYGEGCDTGEHGAAPTLRKPFAPERLVAAVEALAAQETGPAVRPGRGAGRLRRNAGRPARLPALFVARSRSEIAACSSARGARAAHDGQANALRTGAIRRAAATSASGRRKKPGRPSRSSGRHRSGPRADRQCRRRRGEGGGRGPCCRRAGRLSLPAEVHARAAADDHRAGDAAAACGGAGPPAKAHRDLAGDAQLRIRRHHAGLKASGHKQHPPPGPWSKSRPVHRTAEPCGCPTGDGAALLHPCLPQALTCARTGHLRGTTAMPDTHGTTAAAGAAPRGAPAPHETPHHDHAPGFVAR
jgi:DNA-binding response OmpR family regulator